MTVLEERTTSVSSNSTSAPEPEPEAPPRRSLLETAQRLEERALDWLNRHSITALRISMGLVIFGFGFLKFFPGVSPAEGLTLQISELLTFDLLPDRLVMVLLAAVECVIGLSLITGKGLRVTIYLIALWVLGILSPAVLMFSELFSGPNHAPTLTGQYVLKDIVFLAAVGVIASTLCGKSKER